MYTITMKSNKQLIATQTPKIYQRENAIDSIQFLIPRLYDEREMMNFDYILTYVDPLGTVHTELLTKDEEIYKDEFIRIILPITTKITALSGDVIMNITGTWVDPADETGYILHTGDYTLTVNPLKDLYSLVPDEALGAIDARMAEMSAKIKALDILINAVTPDEDDDTGLEVIPKEPDHSDDDDVVYEEDEP